MLQLLAEFAVNQILAVVMKFFKATLQDLPVYMWPVVLIISFFYQIRVQTERSISILPH